MTNFIIGFISGIITSVVVISFIGYLAYIASKGDDDYERNKHQQMIKDYGKNEKDL